MEIERKFIVPELPDVVLEARHVAVRQGYITMAPQAEVRLRAADDACTLTVKSGSGMVRQEHEVGLTAGQFDELWPATSGRRLTKMRYLAPDGALTLEIDVYEGSLTGLVIAEAEFADLEQARAFAPPDWFGAEVTDDPAYSNAALALFGPPPASISDGANAT